MKSSTYYFHMKTKILAYFQISLVPFNVDEKVWNFLCLYRSNCLFSQTRGTFEMSQLQQLINEPTHLTGNSSSCINLIFKSQLNLVMESGVHFSLHSSCRHQIVFAEINLNIFTHHLTNMKFPSSIRLILTLFADQSRSSLDKRDFLIQMQIKKCIY